MTAAATWSGPADLRFDPLYAKGAPSGEQVLVKEGAMGAFPPRPFRILTM